MVLDDGEIMFLEVGPPHELGAHECCYNESDIEGIALAGGRCYSRLEPATFQAAPDAVLRPAESCRDG